jgi:hypothetical protein
MRVSARGRHAGASITPKRQGGRGDRAAGEGPRRAKRDGDRRQMRVSARGRHVGSSITPKRQGGRGDRAAGEGPRRAKRDGVHAQPVPPRLRSPAPWRVKSQPFGRRGWKACSRRSMARGMHAAH